MTRKVSIALVVLIVTAMLYFLLFIWRSHLSLPPPEDHLKNYLSSSILDGLQSKVVRDGGWREPLFVFSINFSESFTLKHLDRPPFSRINNEESKDRLLRNVQYYLSQNIYSKDSSIFFEGGDVSGAWIQIVCNEEYGVVFMQIM